MLKKYIPLILFITVFIVLSLTAYPSIGWWDSGFYAAASQSLGLPVPGGSILYILLGKLFTVLFFFLPTVKAITMLSIVLTSFSSIFFYFTLLLILKNMKLSLNETSMITASFLTALSLPFLYSIWNQANVIRVYILGLFLGAIIIYCAVQIWFADNEAKKIKLFYLLVFLLGLDFAAHRLNSPFLPMLLILLLFPLRKQLKSPKFLLLIVVCYLAGFSIHLYLLLRAQGYPLLDLAYTSTWPQMMSWIKMEQYGRQNNFLILFNRRAPFWDYQINYMYLRYFGWNFLGRAEFATFFHNDYLSYILVIFGCLGFIITLVKKAKTWILLFAMFLCYSIMLILYLNVASDFHLIEREIDRLFLPSFYIFLFWTGIGLFVLYDALTKLLHKEQQRQILSFPIALIFFILLPLNQIVSNWNDCDKQKYIFPRQFAYNLLNSCEKDGILFTNGDNDTYPLWYLQIVEGIRSDIRVINLSLLNLPEYIKRLRIHEPQVPLSLSNAEIDALRMMAWPEPQTVTLPVSPTVAQQFIESHPLIDSLSLFSENATIQFDVAPTIQQRGIRIQDIMILNILKSNQFEKPVYFSTTVSQNNLIGMEEYLSTVGIVRQVIPFKNIKILPNRLEKNILETYTYEGFSDKNINIESTTCSLYNNFRSAYLVLVWFYLENGDEEKAKSIYNEMHETLPTWRFSDKQNEMLAYFDKILK